LLVADNGKKKTNLENSKSYRYLQQLKAKLKEA
jgi:single-stranded-DNA-specific exonuclease